MMSHEESRGNQINIYAVKCKARRDAIGIELFLLY